MPSTRRPNSTDPARLPPRSSPPESARVALVPTDALLPASWPASSPACLPPASESCMRAACLPNRSPHTPPSPSLPPLLTILGARWLRCCAGLIVTLGKTASEYASPPKRTATVAMLSLRVRRVDDLCVSAAVRASSLPSTFSPKTESAAYSSALLLTSIDGGRQRCGSTYKNDGGRPGDFFTPSERSEGSGGMGGAPPTQPRSLA